jgi:hypothetical protein
LNGRLDAHHLDGFRAEANDADVWRASTLRSWPLPRGCDAGAHKMPLAWWSDHGAEER